MTRIFLFVFAGLCLLSNRTHGQPNPDNASYTDPKLGAVLKVRPLSWVYGYLMAGTEIPIGKNRYFDLNIGIPGLGVQRYNSDPGGFLLRTGVRFPMRHTSPYSIIYWMPEFSWGSYKIRDYYYCNNCSQYQYPYDEELVWAKQWNISVNFGYRHVNPASFFYYDIGCGLGVGGLSHPYSIHYNQGPVRPNGDGAGGQTGMMVSGYIAIGKALKRKPEN